jgi:hypothetical protein
LNKNALTLADMMPVIRETLAEGKSVRFNPQGTSMLPMLHPGRDTVVLSPLPETLKKYDLVLYQRKDGSFVLHRIVAVSQTYTCMGDHQFHRETGLEQRQMIGLVTEFVRNGKTVKVTAPGYRIYCMVWHYSRFFRRCLGRLGRIFAGGKQQ